MPDLPASRPAKAATVTTGPARTDARDSTPDPVAAPEPRSASISPWLIACGVMGVIFLLTVAVYNSKVSDREKTIVQNQNRFTQRDTAAALEVAKWEAAKVATEKQQTQLQAQLSEAKAGGTQLKTELDESKVGATEIQTQLDKSRTLSNGFQSQMEDAKVAAIRYQGEVTIAKTQTTVMQAQLAQAQTDTVRLQTQLDESRTNADALQAKLKKAEIEIAQLLLARPKK